ncbi:mediator of RNA polymerase II transcription subunit 15-like [Silurus meridionalis]|uniref:mediator of RNA polymerase II transcription subunit 15-like n=1 Tax=Silurus meridionalis TaxID=175797 RepID=UPI001EEB49E4|nr:mediator of RNA polymerase II transcription subunit 15-like [Silurus meridionalis]
MTKRKFRPCPACQVKNQAIRKCCSACYTNLRKTKKMEGLKDRLDNAWGQGVWKNRNASRVVSSAQVAVQKLAALGYMPILIMGRKKKNSLIADINSGIPLNKDTRPFVDATKKAYEYLLKKQGPQMSPLHPQPDQHIQTPTQPDQQIQHHFDQQIQHHSDQQIQHHFDQQIQHHSDQQIQTHPDQQIQTPTQPEQQIQHHSDQQIQTHPDQQIQTPTQPDQQIQHHSDQQIQTQTEAQQIDDDVILNLYFLPSPSQVQTHSEAQQLQVQPQPQQIQPQTAKPNPQKKKKVK